jgi:hypothetical protein
VILSKFTPLSDNGGEDIKLFPKIRLPRKQKEKLSLNLPHNYYFQAINNLVTFNISIAKFHRTKKKQSKYIFLINMLPIYIKSETDGNIFGNIF